MCKEETGRFFGTEIGSMLHLSNFNIVGCLFGKCLLTFTIVLLLFGFVLLSNL